MRERRCISPTAHPSPAPCASPPRPALRGTRPRPRVRLANIRPLRCPRARVRARVCTRAPVAAARRTRVHFADGQMVRGAVARLVPPPCAFSHREVNVRASVKRLFRGRSLLPEPGAGLPARWRPAPLTLQLARGQVLDGAQAARAVGGRTRVCRCGRRRPGLLLRVA